MSSDAKSPETANLLSQLQELESENKKLRFQLQAQRTLHERIANVRLEELYHESKLSDLHHMKALSVAKTIVEEFDANSDYFNNPEDLVRVIANIATDYAVITLDKDGYVTNCNTGSRRILGWDSENSINKHGSFVYNAQDQEGEAFQTDLEKVRREGIAVAKRWHIKSDNSQFWASSILLPLTRNKIEGYIHLLHDHSDRLDVLKDLQNAEDRINRMMDDIPVMSWAIDHTGCCIFINKAWCNYTGQTKEECLGLGWLDAVFPGDLLSMNEDFTKAHAEKKPFQTEYRLRDSDGQYRWMLCLGAPRFSDTREFIGYIGSVMDIHDRKLSNEN